MEGKVICPIELAFIPIEESLESYFSCEVKFIIFGKEHTISVQGDELSGSTSEIARFYFDDTEYASLEDMKKFMLIDGMYLQDITEKAEIISVDQDDPCYYLAFADYIVGNEKLKQKNKNIQNKAKRKNELSAALPITKRQLMLLAMKPLALLFFAIAMFMGVGLSIVGIIYRNQNGLGVLDALILWGIIFMFNFLSFLLSVYPVYKGIKEIKRQEKALNIYFADSLSGCFLETKGMVSYFKSKTWFIYVLPGKVIAFHRGYIKRIVAHNQRYYALDIFINTLGNRDRRIKVSCNLGEEFAAKDLQKWFKNS